MEFTKEDTRVIKGVAVLLMLMHHLWAFPNRIPGGELKHLFTIFGISSVSFFGLFGQVCVSLFFFLGGYGIYLQSQKKDFNLINNLKKLYIKYWKVFLIFVPIAYIFFKNQIAYCVDASIYTRFNTFEFQNIFKNFIGFSSSINGEWWFFESYIYAIVTFPFIKALIKKNNTTVNILILFILSILMKDAFPAIGNIKELGTLNNNSLYRIMFCQIAPYVSCFWIGMLFAKDNLVVKLKEKIEQVIKLNIIVDLILIFIIVYFRVFTFGVSLDVVYVPILVILFLDLVNRLKLNKLFSMFGSHSTNMWLIHSFLCYYFYVTARFIVRLEWAVPCLLVLIIFTLLCSYIVDYIWKYIDILYNKIKKSLI